MKNLTSLAHVGSDASGIPWDLTPDPNRTDTVASSQPEPGGFDEQVQSIVLYLIFVILYTSLASNYDF